MDNKNICSYINQWQFLQTFLPVFVEWLLPANCFFRTAQGWESRQNRWTVRGQDKSALHFKSHWPSIYLQYKTLTTIGYVSIYMMNNQDSPSWRKWHYALPLLDAFNGPIFECCPKSQINKVFHCSFKIHKSYELTLLASNEKLKCSRIYTHLSPNIAFFSLMRQKPIRSYPEKMLISTEADVCWFLVRRFFL